MKYTVHYTVRKTVDLVTEGKPGHDQLRSMALWKAKNAERGFPVKLEQILPEGVKSDLGDDQPPDPNGPTRPLPPPPMPPLGSAGDLMLARAA